MGKTKIKHPVMKITGHRASDKEDRSKANRSLRRKVRMLIKKGLEHFPLLREISDMWNFRSDSGSLYQKNLEEKWKRK